MVLAPPRFTPCTPARNPKRTKPNRSNARTHISRNRQTDPAQERIQFMSIDELFSAFEHPIRFNAFDFEIDVNINTDELNERLFERFGDIGDFQELSLSDLEADIDRHNAVTFGN